MRSMRAGVVRGFLGEESFGAERSVDFVGRHVVKEFAFEGSFPGGCRDVEEVGGAEHIGADEGQRVHNGPVDMAFGGQVNNGVGLVLRE